MEEGIKCKCVIEIVERNDGRIGVKIAGDRIGSMLVCAIRDLSKELYNLHFKELSNIEYTPDTGN